VCDVGKTCVTQVKAAHGVFKLALVSFCHAIVQGGIYDWKITMFIKKLKFFDP
jgi:hypothetical protein